ncbi:Fur family transcriptional regulator [Leeia sp.]|uniref:Fur family transcriptional regulator n=1 Tax=Leeia sp. TaxID=2884678 RepID=UPI0035B0C377
MLPFTPMNSLPLALQAAQQWCLSRGEKLTDSRREVLALLLQAGGPLKAYDILACLQKAKPTAAPPTVYRALDFLVSMGLVHRLESLNAFVACEHGLTPHHQGVLLICQRCHQVTEVAGVASMRQLQQDAAAAQFTITAHELEIKGVCHACQQEATA